MRRPSAAAMQYYWLYYLAILSLSYAQQEPRIAILILAFVALRPWLPDPVVIVRNVSRIARLRNTATINAADVIARRDLGVSYLEMRMPGAAIGWLDQAKKLDPKNREIAFLRGRALLAGRRNEEAVRAFGEAVGIDPERGEPFSSKPAGATERAFLRYAEVYLGAAEALERLGRLDQAADALELSAASNSSRLEPLVRLGRVRAKKGDAEGARAAYLEARKTWSALPWFLKRRQIGLYVRALLG